jgi:DNA-binding MarR family transcriptional regulator
MNQKNNPNNCPDDEDFRLWKFLDRTTHVILLSRELELASFGLTQEQAYVLDIINNHGGLTTIGVIAEITLRQHHSISALIARMEKQGLVAKKRNSENWRQYDIIMTERGRDLLQKTTLRKSIEAVFSALSRENKRELSALLTQLLSSGYKETGKYWDPAEETIPCSG